MITNKSAQSIIESLQQLWGHVNKRRRHQFILLLILMVVASFAEVLSISAIVPLLGVLTSPESIFNHHSARPVINYLGMTEPKDLLLPITVVFCCAAVFAGATRLLLLWYSTRLSFSFGADVSIDIYRRTLYQPYAVHLSRNSSEVLTGISQKVNILIFQTINPVLQFISAMVMLVAIVAILFSIDTTIALSAFIGFGSIYFFIVASTRRRLKKDSQRIARETTRIMQALREGLGGIRDILLDGTQQAYCAIYRSADIPLRRSQVNGIVIGSSPRYAIESLGMVFIACIAYLFTQNPEDRDNLIPVLGALALGAQKLLPMLQQAYVSITNIRTGNASLRDALCLLNQPLPAYLDQPAPDPIVFRSEIRLRNVYFRYHPESPMVLDGIDLSIKKGSHVGIIGSTGSGKSTLVDLIMALLSPTKGTIEIDGVPITALNHRAWQMRIAHVPQSIYLADCSIEENIAFGLPLIKIDTHQVKLAAQQAQIDSVIKSWPNQYSTSVGERGVRLSGGQRQRIGIARALYKQADVLIFDEATSALDSGTESAVMQSIEALGRDITVIIIAHRLSTLQSCDMVIELDNGRVKRQGSYAEMIIN